MKKITLNNDGSLNIMNFDLITVLVDDYPEHEGYPCYYKLDEARIFKSLKHGGPIPVHGDHPQEKCLWALTEGKPRNITSYLLQFSDANEFNAWKRDHNL